MFRMFLWFGLRNVIKVHKPLCQKHKICELQIRFGASKVVVKHNLFVDDENVNSRKPRKSEDCDRKTSEILNPCEQLPEISRCFLCLFGLSCVKKYGCRQATKRVAKSVVVV